MSYEVHEIELSKIFNDSDFNCRGTIYPMDVVDLVRDIEEYGLQFPIAVQPISDMSEPEDGFDYRIIAGHRRFVSFQILKKETIPAMVKEGLSEKAARLLNLGENLKRQDLNLLQEAKAIERLRFLGMNRRQVSEALSVSVSWVQVRYNLLDLPEEIQAEAAAGLLNQQQIKQIFSLKIPTRQYAAVKKIKDARLRGEAGIDVGKPPEQNLFKKKRQSKNVVFDMMSHMANTVGHGLHTRAMAWCNGEINTAELYFDIKHYAIEKGIEYRVPLSGENE